MLSTDAKTERLNEILRGFEDLAVAYSAGVDSTFLLAAAHEALGEKAAAVTCETSVFTRRERAEAAAFCMSRGITRIITSPDILSLRAFTENPPDRCYHCKRAIMLDMLGAARKNGFSSLAEGSNADDAGAYRPGMRAVRELGIRSPLLEAGLTKAEIRGLSKEMGLPTWDKPSFACLATRIEHGVPVTAEALARIESAEEFIASLGFRQYRVRVHGDLARIEVEKELIPLAAEKAGLISETLLGMGFGFVTLDLTGFRSGSMDAKR
jgi:uncharacterized protein